MYINRVGSNTVLQERSTECTVSYNYTCDLCQLGFFLLDLHGDESREKFLKDIEAIFSITEDVMRLDLEEKATYN